MKKYLLITVMLASWAFGSAYAAVPPGWYLTGSAAKHYDVGTQAGNRSGSYNAYLRAKTDATTETNGFGTLMQTISADAYRNKRVRFSGYLKTKDAGQAALWVRIDGSDRRILGFDNMEKRALHGDNDWQNYSVVLDVPAEAADIAFGFLLQGKGEVLADDFTFQTVGKDVPTTGNVLPQSPVNLAFQP